LQSATSSSLAASAAAAALEAAAQSLMPPLPNGTSSTSGAEAAGSQDGLLSSTDASRSSIKPPLWLLEKCESDPRVKLQSPAATQQQQQQHIQQTPQQAHAEAAESQPHNYDGNQPSTSRSSSSSKREPVFAAQQQQGRQQQGRQQQGPAAGVRASSSSSSRGLGGTITSSTPLPAPLPAASRTPHQTAVHLDAQQAAAAAGSQLEFELLLLNTTPGWCTAEYVALGTEQSLRVQQLTELCRSETAARAAAAAAVAVKCLESVRIAVQQAGGAMPHSTEEPGAAAQMASSSSSLVGALHDHSACSSTPGQGRLDATSSPWSDVIAADDALALELMPEGYVRVGQLGLGLMHHPCRPGQEMPCFQSALPTAECDCILAWAWS
jgi:hypothetical protein